MTRANLFISPLIHFEFFWGAQVNLFWNWVNLSQISITSRSSLAANYFKHWFCFYASSIWLEAFVYISWLGISATTYTCQLSEPFSELLCYAHFPQVYHHLQHTTFVRLVATLVFCCSASILYENNFLPTFYILVPTDWLHFYPYSLFYPSEFFYLL